MMLAFQDEKHILSLSSEKHPFFQDCGKNIFSQKLLYKINLKQCNEIPLAPQIKTYLCTVVSEQFNVLNELTQATFIISNDNTVTFFPIQFYFTVSAFATPKCSLERLMATRENLHSNTLKLHQLSQDSPVILWEVQKNPIIYETLHVKYRKFPFYERLLYITQFLQKTYITT